MKAAVVREPGAADALKVESDFPVPDIAAGQVLVKNAFAGINFIDTYHRSGLYARDLPFVGGQEGGGEVVAVGSRRSKTSRSGDKVAYSVFGSTPSTRRSRRRSACPYPTTCPWTSPCRASSRA